MQEITNYSGDTNDNWRVDAAGNIHVGQQIRLIHVNTDHALHSHGGLNFATTQGGNNLVQEVTGLKTRDANDLFAVEYA